MNTTTNKKANKDQKNRRVLVEYLIVTVILIATSFTPYKPAGLLLAFVYLFLEAFLRKRRMEEIGFSIRSLPHALRDNWLFILLVVFVAPLLTVAIGKLFLPEFFTHILARVTPYVDIGAINGLFVQLLVLAFGEEILFRAFLQGRLSLFIDPRWAILFSAAVFAAVHFTPGVPVIVALDLLSVFVDGLLYGIIFKRSNNVYASTIAHFLANSFGVIILILISRGM
jgi:membrane protease YdiL (CAAX protease family)